MSDAPSGIRRAEDEALLRGPPPYGDEIVPDRVGPAVEGYFRFPAIWVEKEPNFSDVATLNPPIHHEVVFKKVLSCGIEVRVQRDGLFWFDFTTWVRGPITIIPGYRLPEPKYPHTPPRAHQEQSGKAEEIAVQRAQVMNAHQACLTTAESVVMRRSAGMGFPVTSWSTLKALSFRSGLTYADDVEDMHALAQNVLNNKYAAPRERPLARRTIELPVIEYSFYLLDKILSNKDVILIHLIETIYISACRQREKRFGEAVILAWGVCEQAILTAWQQLLDSTRSAGGTTNRMSRDRRKKLTGRDYTASVMAEMLEFTGRISHDQYRTLEVARKARNNWAHRMTPPKSREAFWCQKAAEQLISELYHVPLSLQSGGRGGVPQWPYWMWQREQDSVGG